MNEPTKHTRISWDDNATSFGSPPNNHVTTDSDINDTTEDDEVSDFRARSPGDRSPVTFYIESESSKVGTLREQHRDCIYDFVSIVIVYPEDTNKPKNSFKIQNSKKSYQ